MKKFLHYIYNFFYVSVYWNPLLAVFITWHEIKRGSRYGINTIKPGPLKGLTIADGDISKSSPYEAVNYYILENLLENFRRLFPEEKNLTDVGCGKGRVMVAAAYYGFTKITGVDFAKELCEEAEKNMQLTKKKFTAIDYKVIYDNALNYPLTAADTVFFLFNPFNKEMLEKFTKKVVQSINQFPRTVYFLYASPKYLDVLQKSGFNEVYHIKKMKILEGVIAVNPISTS